MPHYYGQNNAGIRWTTQNEADQFIVLSIFRAAAGHGKWK